MQILHLPIRAVRLVTDPSVDAVIYCLRLLGLVLLRWSKVVCTRALYLIGFWVAKDFQTWVTALFERIDFQHILSLSTITAGDHRLFTSQVGKATSWEFMGTNVLSYVPFDIQDGHYLLSSLVTSMSESSVFRFTEEWFAILGRQVRLAFVATLREWMELAEGDGTMERLWAILLGYAIAAFFAALYLNTITVGNVRSAGRAVRNAIRQQMIVLKVFLTFPT
jgi:E3 ubiquitin-protein ligase MARCH6